MTSGCGDVGLYVNRAALAFPVLKYVNWCGGEIVERHGRNVIKGNVR